MALHVEPSPGIAPAAHPKAREPLPPGILPNITDTDPPPLHPATEVGDGYVRVNQEKLHEHRAGPPTPHHAPVEHGAAPAATHTTTVTVTRTATH